MDFFISLHQWLKMHKSFEKNERIQNNRSVIFISLEEEFFDLGFRQQKYSLQANISKFKDLGIGLYINDWIFWLKLFCTHLASYWKVPKIWSKVKFLGSSYSRYPELGCKTINKAETWANMFREIGQFLFPSLPRQKLF